MMKNMRHDISYSREQSCKKDLGCEDSYPSDDECKVSTGSEEMSVIRINDAIRQVGLDEQATGMSEQS